jgi:hypothetical protein
MSHSTAVTHLIKTALVRFWPAIKGIPACGERYCVDGKKISLIVVASLAFNRGHRVQLHLLLQRGE